jgi:hypothetical protein
VVTHRAPLMHAPLTTRPSPPLSAISRATRSASTPFGNFRILLAGSQDKTALLLERQMAHAARHDHTHHQTADRHIP